MLSGFVPPGQPDDNLSLPTPLHTTVSTPGYNLAVQPSVQLRIDMAGAARPPPPPGRAAAAGGQTASVPIVVSTDEDSEDEDDLRAAPELMRVRSCQNDLFEIVKRLDLLTKKLDTAHAGIRESTFVKAPVYLTLVDSLCLRDTAKDLEEKCKAVAERT